MADLRLAAAERDRRSLAIDQRGQALRDNPGVVALVQAEKWNGQLPYTMPPNGTVPFLDLAPSSGIAVTGQ